VPRKFDEALNKMYEKFLQKAVIQTPTGKDGAVDYDKVPVGATIWVTVTKPGPLQGRHIQITKRPDGLFALTGGSGYKQVADKHGVETPTAALRHLVVGGTPEKSTREKELSTETEEAEKHNVPFIEKKKELLKLGKEKIDEAFKEFKDSIGAEEGLTSNKLKEHRQELIQHATDTGLDEAEANQFASTIIRHVAAANKQLSEIKAREAGAEALKVFTKLRSMKELKPEEAQAEIDRLNQSIGDFRGITVDVPDPGLFKGMTPEEIDNKTGDIINEAVQTVLNPDPEDKTLDKELAAEGGNPEDEKSSEIPTIEVGNFVKPLEIKNMDQLKESVDRFKKFHEVQNEINEVKRNIKKINFTQSTPELLEQMRIEAKAITPDISDSDIAEIEQSYEENYTANNSALSFYSALGEFWNDKKAMSEKLNKIDSGFGNYVGGGATSAIAALTGRYFGKRTETASLVEKTSVEAAALVTAFQYRDAFAKNLTGYNEIIKNISKYNTENQGKTEQEALKVHKDLQTKFKTIESEEQKGTLTSKAFSYEAKIDNLISQKKNLGSALGSMQASAAFLNALITARDAEDTSINLDFGSDKKAADLRFNELNIGDRGFVDTSDPSHIRISTSVRGLQRYVKSQDVISENHDENERIKNNEEGTFTDDEGKVFVKDYSVPGWKDEIEGSDGQPQKHYFRVEQRNDIEFLKRAGGGVISRPTGIGKTNISLGFFANKIHDDPNYSALAVVPKGRVKQWLDEGKRFTNLDIVEVPEGLNKDKRAEILASIKPGQIAVISHRDAVYSYYTLEAASSNGLFKGMVIDEPQELASKSVTGNMSASVRKLTKLPVDNRIALTATPARDNLIEAYDLANWASHHDKSLGPRTRFQKIYGGYGSGTNAQDSTLQQMIYHEIAPFISGGKISSKNFKVKKDTVTVAKSEAQNNNMRTIEKNADKYIESEKQKYINAIESNTEDLQKWTNKHGNQWKAQAAIKAGKIAKETLLRQHDDNLEGTYAETEWKDNPKVSANIKNIMSAPEKKHVIFLDNMSQRNAVFNGLTESGLKENQIENIASTTMSSRISGSKMGDRVKNFRKDKNVRVIFIDKQSASGYNLQEGDVLHVLGTPSDAANYVQAQGRIARMPRVGDVDIKTYRYSDVPFEDVKWSRIDSQMKILQAVAPAQFVE